MPFSWSRDRERGLVRREPEAILCAAPPCVDAAYEARDMRSEAAANDWRDWRSSVIAKRNIYNN